LTPSPTPTSSRYYIRVETRRGTQLGNRLVEVLLRDATRRGTRKVLVSPKKSTIKRTSSSPACATNFHVSLCFVRGRSLSLSLTHTHTHTFCRTTTRFLCTTSWPTSATNTTKTSLKAFETKKKSES
jgi:hypothetical protein